MPRVNEDKSGKPNLTIITNDEKKVVVNRELWYKYALASAKLYDDSGFEEIVAEISETVANRMIDYMQLLENNPAPTIMKPLRSIDMADNVEPKEYNDLNRVERFDKVRVYADFIKKYSDFEDLEDLLIASMDQEFNELLEICKAAMGAIVRQTRGNIDEFRKRFSIKNDLTAEDMEVAYSAEALQKAVEQHWGPFELRAEITE